MKKTIFLFCVLLIVQNVYSQDQPKKFKFPINEYNVSLNRSNLYDKSNHHVENRVGYGFGIYRSGSSKKLLNIVTGLEFNYTQHFRRFIYEPDYVYMLSVTYHNYSYSLPVGLRVNIGDNVRIFFEAGIFADYLRSSKKNGIYYQEVNPMGAMERKPFDKDAEFAKYNYGFYGGLGTTIPAGKIEFVLKADLKVGLVNLQKDLTTTDLNMNKHFQEIYNRYLRFSLGIKF